MATRLCHQEGLRILPFVLAFEPENGFACPSCGAPMELHQPEPGLPDRMLGTCAACATWCLVSTEPESPNAVIALLPDGLALRAELDA